MRLFLMCFSVIFSSILTAQLRINEYSAHKGLEDNGVNCDWIELINVSGSPVQLDEHFLSDDPQDLYKWSCPDYLLEPGEIIVICASGLDITSRIHHWESVVMAEDDWRYFLGSQEPPSNWNQLGFASNSWPEGPGGIGYGDGDDNTLIDAFPSVYMRKEFVIEDLDNVLAAVL
ncbi:MAG: lamin tail domain-containing protein, partial [Flavobacteriales bacterium]|nr:lamin tail domain-containing protein [Flavobacteriales bacterium]